MLQKVRAGSILLLITPLLASCWGGPSKSDVEALFNVKIEFMECSSTGGPGYECSGKTTSGTTFTRRFIKADGRWRAV